MPDHGPDSDRNAAKEKAAARALARKARLEMGRPDRARASAQICALLEEIDVLAKATVIAGFWPSAEEVDIRHFLVNAIRAGRSVYLPRVVEQGRPLAMHNMSLNGIRLATGYGGIMEPIFGTQGLGSEIPACVLAPSISADKSGNRLGSGLGFYDITISDMPESTLIAPIFDCQLADRLPVEGHDVKVSIVVTERGVLDLRT